MTATTLPLSIEIGATLGASLGAALRSTEAQLGKLGSTLAKLEGHSAGLTRLESLKRQAGEVGAAWRQAQSEIARLQQAKASGEWTTKGLASARARVAELEARLADPALSARKRERLEATLAKARERLAAQQAKADERFARQIERLAQQAGRAKDQYDRLKASIAQETTALERSGIATSRASTDQAKLGQALDLLKSRYDKLAQAQAKHQAVLEQRAAYRGQIMDAAALGGALYGLTKPAIAFEESLVGIRRVSNFADAEYARLGDAILKLSTRLPLAAEQLAAITAQGARIGIAGAELDRFTEAAGRMAVAWGMTGEEAGKELGALKDAYRLTLDESERVADGINHLSNQMRAEGAELFRILAKAGPSARAFGLSATQVTALGAAFLHMKAEPKAAATAIDSLLKKLATADKQGKDFQEALFRVGISAEVFAEMVKRDPQQALMTFLDLVKRSPEGMPLLTDLFGEGQADDIARLIDGLDDYKRALSELAGDKSIGSLKEEYETIAKSTSNSLQLLKNQATRLMVTLGSAILPGLNALVGAISKPIESIAELAQRFPILTQVVVGATAGLIGLKIASLGVGYAWTFVSGGATLVTMAIARVRAGLALLRAQSIMAGPVLAGLRTGFLILLPAIGATTAALLANPITWVVAGIGAAVAGLALVIRKYWEPLAAWVSGFWDGIKRGMEPAITGIGQALAPLAPIGDAIAAVFGLVGDAISGVVGWVGELLAPVKITQDEFGALADSGRSVGMVIGQTLATAIQALTLPLQGVAKLVDAVGQGIAKLGGILGFGGTASATAPTPTASAVPVLAPQPVFRSPSTSTSITAPITIHAPAGADAREIARLVDERMRGLLRDQSRRVGALYD